MANSLLLNLIELIIGIYHSCLTSFCITYEERSIYLVFKGNRTPNNINTSPQDKNYKGFNLAPHSRIELLLLLFQRTKPGMWFLINKVLPIIGALCTILGYPLLYITRFPSSNIHNGNILFILLLINQLYLPYQY